MNCKELESFSFPTNCKVISSLLLSSCTKLISVVISESIEIVFCDAFSDCNSLRSFEVSLDNMNLMTDSTKEYLMSRNGTILYSTSCGPNLTIPKSVKTLYINATFGRPIKSIDFGISQLEDLMNFCIRQITLDSVTFPPTLKTVQSSAFLQSTIRSITFMKSPEIISNSALYGLRGLEEINILIEGALIKENGIVFSSDKTIIYFIPSNTSVLNIPTEVKKVEKSQVQAENILEVNVTEGSKYLSSFEGLLYNSDQTQLLACPGGRTYAELSPLCTKISDEAFLNVPIKTVKLNEGLKEIGFHCFGECINLSSINFPNTIETIERWAFSSTINLKVNIELGQNLSKFRHYSFYKSHVRSVDMHKCINLSTLENNIFHLSTLEQIILPPNVKKLSDELFRYATMLKNITFPCSVETIGKCLLLGCKNLNRVIFEGSNIKLFPDEFLTETNICEISVPDSVEVLGSNCFGRCKRLTKIGLNSTSNLKTIMPSIISECGSLKEFTIPPGVEEIREGAFMNSIGLKRFNCDDSNSNFKSYDGLLYNYNGTVIISAPGAKESVTISSSCIEIFTMSFSGCRKLLSVRFPKESKIKYLNDNTFLNCTSLKYVTLPESLEGWSSTAFSGCLSLVSVKFEGENFKLKVIAPNSFTNCVNLSTFVFPPSLEEIGSSAFDGCSSLESIKLKKVTKIYERAFFGCNNLSSLVLPSSISIMGQMSFGSCKSLSNVRFCGFSDIKSSGEYFNGSPLKEVLVPTTYYGEKFGDVPVKKVLDSECHIPTVHFSPDASIASIEVQAIEAALLSCNE